MKRSERLNRVWWAFSVGLLLAMLGAVAYSIWGVESWGWRIAIWVATGMAGSFAFMASTFLFAGLANSAAMEERRQSVPEDSAAGRLARQLLVRMITDPLVELEIPRSVEGDSASIRAQTAGGEWTEIATIPSELLESVIRRIGAMARERHDGMIGVIHEDARVIFEVEFTRTPMGVVRIRSLGPEE